MGISTSTGTLIAGQSRTFNLSPASAVTLTLSPNVRVTITETPESVSGSGVGGNTTRVHEPQLPGTFAYGPYAMGGVVVVAVASNSGSSVAWTRKDTVVTTSSDGTSLVSTDGNSFLVGPVTSGAWIRVQAAPRLRLTGTGTAVVDTKAADGSIQLAAYTFYASGSERIEWPYPGDNGTQIRVTLTGSAAAEVL